MNKDDILQYPKLDNEVITVENFMVIKKAKMKCGDITVLVGKQAAGKSLLAKLRYFFWDYQQGLLMFLLQHSNDPSKFKNIKDYNKLKIEYFCELFPNIEDVGGQFAVQFQSSKISMSVTRDKKGSKIKIDYSKGLADIIKHIIRVFDEINIYLGEQRKLKKNSASKDSDSLSRLMFLESLIPSDNTPHVLYIPASRLFLATIQDNIFRFLASGDYSLDELLMQFGSFWERHKQYFSDEFKNPKRNKSWFKQASKILEGDYVYRNKFDYIKNNWGEMVRLRDASSGQQEVLPLLVAINAFPRESDINQLLIIEEPEAHIYPTSQRVLIKMIAEVFREKGCKVMITTHSPYVPTCLNNEILISQNKDRPLAVTAYHVSNGKTQDIYDKEDDLIDTNQLDSASGEIMNEYFKALEEYDARTEGKDKNGE